MRAILRAILPALAGSTLGFVVHQLLAQRSAPERERRGTELIIASPISNAAIAIAAGAIAGRRAAFLTGFALSAAAGSKLDSGCRPWQVCAEEPSESQDQSGPESA